MPDIQDLLIPVVILVVVIGFLIALMLLSRNYIKVSPNRAAVISGRSRKLADGTAVGYRLVRGGATLIFPFLEKVEYLSLNVITVPLATQRAYTVQGVPVSVKAVANVKIKGDDDSMRSAAERFWACNQMSFISSSSRRLRATCARFSERLRLKRSTTTGRASLRN